MASRAPASALLNPQSVVGAADQEFSALNLLEVTFQTEIGIANTEQLGVDRAVRIMTGGAAFARGIMLEGIGTPLLRVTAQAHVVLR